MVLNCQLKVRERHGDERGYNDKDDEHNEQDRVDSVHLVAPDTSKDVV